MSDSNRTPLQVVDQLASTVRALPPLTPAHLDLRNLLETPHWDEDALASLTLWANTPEGHDLCSGVGLDPDFWPALVPYDFIIGVVGTELLVYSRLDAAATLGRNANHLERRSPTTWHVPRPAEARAALRVLVAQRSGIATRAAIGILLDSDLTSQDATIGITAAPLASGGLAIHADATAPLLGALRARGVTPIWDDKSAFWRVAEREAVQALGVLREARIPLVTEGEPDQREPGDFLLDEREASLDLLRDVPIDQLSTLGARRVQKFNTFGVRSIFDLLMLAPRRYLDRSSLQQLSAVSAGQEVAVVGTINDIAPNISRRFVRFQISDGTGTLSATFFNALWMAKRYKKGDRVIVLGKADEWRGRSRTLLQMTNPLMEAFTEDSIPIIPIYPQSGKQQVSTWEIRRATEEALNRLPELDDPLPSDVIQELDLAARHDSLRLLHFPRTLNDVSASRRRLAFDEFLRLQLALLQARRVMEAELAVVQKPDGSLTQRLRDSLPFPLTTAQERVWAEVVADISDPAPMHRLLQGDVGSGKTLMAILALLAGLEGGHQGALMAPTEILATQLHAELVNRLTAAGLTESVTTALLTSKTKASDRRRVLAGLHDGSIGIAVGTHSLISEAVSFHSLGVVVIDEQHRFGVEQRAALRSKVSSGAAPDMLVMTATPIPRTAAITAFGDLETSVIDELPPGRTPIETIWTTPRGSAHLASEPHWADVLNEVSKGRQAFIVCPLVEGSEKLQAASAVKTYETLASGCLSGVRVLLVHGQQPADERAAAMQAFAEGDADVLVSTTVIEVGVNVPNASRMVILDAERFGIAQLHQLRGRVGRGEHPSRCYLLGSPTSSEGEQRLQALCDSTDGFYLSEIDLALRGAGNILGSEQSGGVSDLRIADLLRDKDLLEMARTTAQSLLSRDPGLDDHPALRNEVRAALGEGQAQWLFKS